MKSDTRLDGSWCYRWLHSAALNPEQLCAGSVVLCRLRTLLHEQWIGSWLIGRFRRSATIVRWIPLGCVMVSMVAVSHPSLRVAWAVVFVSGAFSLVLLKRLDRAHWEWLRRFFLTALVAHVIVTIGLYLISPRVWIATEAGRVQNGGFFTGDGHVYAHNGQWLAESWHRGVFPRNEQLLAVSMSKTSGPYDYWAGLIIYWLGYHPMTLFLINCLFGVWTGVLAYWIARLYVPESGARLAGWLSAYWPSLFLWSTQNLKEPISVCLLMGGLYCFLVPARGPRWALCRLIGMGFMWALKAINPFIGPLAIVSIVLATIVRLRSVRVVCLVSGALVLSVVLMGRFSVLQSLTARMDQFVFHRPMTQLALNPQQFTRQVEYMRRVRMEESRTPFLHEVHLESPEHAIRFLPLAFVGVLTLPMPWTARSFSECVGAMEMLLWYPLMFFALKGIVRALRAGSAQALLLITTLVICTAIGLLEGNVGTLFRHRAAAWPLLLFFVASGLGQPMRTGELP